MNNISLKGIIKDIQPSHTVSGISFDKAKIITKRENGQEDIIDVKFKSFSNKHKENDSVSIKGNVRSYSYKVDSDKNKVAIYVFTYFDPIDDEVETGSNNTVHIDGRICELNSLRENKSGKHNIHFILANNLLSSDGNKRLNSYIPCIAWGKVAKEISTLSVSDKIEIVGELHSREHKKIHPNGEVEFRVAHELLVKEFKVVE